MSSKENLGEEFAIEWLARHGLRAERFSKAQTRQSKTPDFRVFKGTEFVLYCESKHVKYDEWLDKQLADAQPLEVVGGLRHDPIYNRLADRIRAEKLTVDLYVWLNKSKGQQQKGTLYFNAGSKHYVALSALLGSDPAKHRRVG
jgi:hypothetical protein